MSDMLLVHHTVRGARRLLIFPVTVPRMKDQFAVPPADGCPSSECGVGCSAPYLTNSWNKSSLFCRCLELYVPWEDEPSALDWLVSTSLLSDPYLGEWNHTNGENP
jgi:hypothetical protein